LMLLTNNCKDFFHVRLNFFSRFRPTAAEVFIHVHLKYFSQCQKEFCIVSLRNKTIIPDKTNILFK
jgi:hypothetical protein